MLGYPLAATPRAARGRWKTGLRWRPIPHGLCNVGVVAEVGAGVSGFAVGDRVASSAKNAEAVSVGTNGLRVVQLTPQ